MTDTQTKDIFQGHNKIYNTAGVAMQDKQQNSGGTVQHWQRTQFQILLNLPKWYIQIFFNEEGGRNPPHSESKINDCR